MAESFYDLIRNFPVPPPEMQFIKYPEKLLDSRNVLFAREDIADDEVNLAN